MRPAVCVMMSTYNGEKYISEQIDSILGQNHVDVTLMIRDDGSTDGTLALLRKYEAEHDNISVCTGANLGYARSFWSILLNAPENCNYYAFSDQDDVWEPNKLASGIHALRQSKDACKLYASALNVTDADLNFQYKNVFKKLKPQLGSAITRPRLSGCTMIFTPGLLRLCKKMDICQPDGKCMSHDGAVYLTYLACGGKILFSQKSYIKLRRHEETVTGHGKGIIKRITSVTNIFTTRRHEATQQAGFLYSHLKDDMTVESRALCEDILHYRNSLSKTLKLCFDKRIKCNLFSVDAITFFAVLFRCY